MAAEKVEFVIGKMIEFTEDDRREMLSLAKVLVFKIDNADSGVAQIILKLFRITQRAIARSHAN